MNDHHKKAPQSADPGKLAAVKELERRSGERLMFTAAADVVELSSGARFCTRTTDIGLGGCFIDTTNPFSVGAKVRVTMRKGKNELNTTGVVVYSQHGLGMGVSFADLQPEQRLALSAWIGQVTGEAPGVSEGAHSTHRAETAHMSHGTPSDRATVVRLVRLLITKGILTEAEGSSVLVEPVL